MSLNCTFDPNDPGRFPYAYYDANGTLLVDGVEFRVNSSTSVCVFDTPACLHNSSCCVETAAQNAASASFAIPLVCFIVGYVLFLVGMRHPKSKAFWGIKGPMRPDSSSEGTAWLKGQPKHIQCLVVGVFVAIYMAAIMALVFEATIMPKSIQNHLEPADRSAQLAMESFITPMQEIFQFIEDTMLVKVGYAIAAKRHDEINALLHIGVVGGFVSAVCAFAIALVILYIGPAARFVINPSHASNALLIDGGCALVPTTERLLSHASLYWVLMTLRWIPKFSMLSVFGFLIGSGRMFPWMFSMIIQGVLPIVVWFSLLGKAGMLPLHALGIAYSLPDWVLGVGMLVYFVCNGELRREYGLTLLCCGGGNTRRRGIYGAGSRNVGGGGSYSAQVDAVDTENDSARDTTWRTVLLDVLRGGVQLMVVDLAVQLSITITIYVAATQHVMTSYKLAAAQAAYWSFGPQYLVGINMMLKLFGSRLMGVGRFRAYAANFFYAFLMTCSLAVGAVVLGVSQGAPIAFDFGSSACVFASTKGCANVYAGIFAGDDSLQQVFSQVFGPTVAMQLLFLLLRAGLATVHDFAFMARASSVCFVVAFVPAIVLARVQNTAMTYFIAMYAPHFLMILVFGWRMLRHLRAIRAGQDGPWTVHSKTLERKRTLGRESMGEEAEAEAGRATPLIAQ